MVPTLVKNFSFFCVLVYEENINGTIFANFAARRFVPFLQPFDGKSPRSVVAMDNASIHHVRQSQH